MRASPPVRNWIIDSDRRMGLVSDPPTSRDLASSSRIFCDVAKNNWPNVEWDWQSLLFYGWSMKFTTPVAAILLFGGTLFGQLASPPSRPQTFHVWGTIKDPLAGVIPGVKVTFQSEPLTTTVTTNKVGVYEADLPLGDYSMTAQGPRGFRFYRRPLFRVTSPATVVLNATLLVGNPCGDITIFNSSGEPITDEQWKASTENCRREELIQIPSGDGTPFQLSILYGSRALVGSTYSYNGEKTHQYEAPVFVTYNLFSLHADKVIYDAENRTIEASGNVVAVNEVGTDQRADSMVFKIENGQVTLLR